MEHELKRHNLAHPQGLIEFNQRVEFYKEQKKIVVFGWYSHTRTNPQNASIHKYCDMIADELNGAGYFHSIVSIIDGDLIEVPFTMEIIKEGLWRAIQLAEFGIKSTTKIDSTHINKIIDIITVWLSVKGIQVDFPKDKNK